MDDITICRVVKEELNLQNFLNAARMINLTFYMDKCVFGTERISSLGHIIENETKKPDPDRLTRLIGFFAYCAKWVHDYSNKIRLLLEAQKSKSFPLKESAINAVAMLKADIANATLAIPEESGSPLVLETKGTMGDNPVCSALEEASIIHVGISFTRNLLIYSWPHLHSYKRNATLTAL